LLLGAAVLAAGVSGCRRDDEVGKGPATGPAAGPELLDFPLELRAEDESVNAFIAEVIETCASGDYEAFRLLWSARDDPFPRDQFHRAWQSVRRVKVVGLRQVKDADSGRLLYATRALVELDPTVRDPQRDVTILIVKEDDRWRLTKPPASLPENLFEPTPAATSPTTQPHAASE
jgi:hypothetical protein